jgi:hypothetical protein
MGKSKNKEPFLEKWQKWAITIVLSLIAGFGLNVAITPTETGHIVEIKYTMELSDKQLPEFFENDQGEITEGEIIPTFEEIDGGLFEDEELNTEYGDKGWSETYDTSTPEAFRNDTLGKCIIANNKYGAQCVSLARVFWWSYANRDVSTCGTGMAKGMMNCSEENAGDDFLVYWANDKHQIQAGDWLVFDGGLYGHVGMAVSPVVNGYVTLLGENQGGKACEGGGAVTNIINISVKNLIGFYRPKAYIKPEPVPEPFPISNCTLWHVEKGDTMSKIMLDCEGTIQYGEAMDNYAKTWYSLIYKKGQSVYEGWNSPSGVGLYADDDIEHRIK